MLQLPYLSHKLSNFSRPIESILILERLNCLEQLQSWRGEDELGH